MVWVCVIRGHWGRKPCSISIKMESDRDFPGGPVAKTLELPSQRTWVLFTVRELDPICYN